MSWFNSYRIEHIADPSECHGFNSYRIEHTADLTECHGLIHIE